MSSLRISNWKQLIISATLSGTILATPVIALAGKEFTMPEAQPARTYPAHDEHSKELITVALDPYDMADKARIFSVNYHDLGFVPIFMVITNDGDQPLEISSMKAELVTVNRSKILPSGPDDIERRLSGPQASDKHYPLPFPIPGKKVKGGVSKEARQEIETAIFAAKAVEPHGTQAGFLFFDVSGITAPLAGAHFYLTGVRDAKGHEVMFFEIPLESYLSAPSKPGNSQLQN